eukprot:TRINITY_DN21221_c0_g1_i1.p1 TRINITY_DN21221_c0_g1~~TRINITY_DN21221_c0_g1_i1.p1  ORF type:complete len:316 (+),score=33.19 TRINITY_DN21221_c0_g1_i1:53-1000(+)
MRRCLRMLVREVRQPHKCRKNQPTGVTRKVRASSCGRVTDLKSLFDWEKRDVDGGMCYRPPQGGEVFVFDYGAVVCWDFPEEHDNELLAAIQAKKKPVSVAPIVKQQHSQLPQQEDEFTYEAIDDTSISIPQRIGDHILLNSNWNNDGFKEAISHAIAQSTLLDVLAVKFELISNVTGSATKLNMTQGTSLEKMAWWKCKPTTTPRLKQSDADMLIGMLDMLHREIHIESPITDPEEIFWDNDELEAVYKDWMEYLDCNHRLAKLEKRMDIVRRELDTIVNQHKARRECWNQWLMVTLEVIIVVEILIEIIGMRH